MQEEEEEEEDACLTQPKNKIGGERKRTANHNNLVSCVASYS